MPTSHYTSEPGKGYWEAYTPTWTSDGTQPSLGNGSLTGRYCFVGETVFFSIVWSFGSTSSAGTGTWFFGVPITASDANRIHGVAHIEDAGTGYYTASTIPNSTVQFNLVVGDAAGGRQLAATVPITWATGDDIRIGGFYEAASI